MCRGDELCTESDAGSSEQRRSRLPPRRVVSLVVGLWTQGPSNDHGGWLDSAWPCGLGSNGVDHPDSTDVEAL